MKSKILIYSIGFILSGAIIIAPLKVVLNIAGAARSTLISPNKAVKTVIPQNKGFAGAGWTPNVGGLTATTSLTKATCEAASGWAWFADGNGDGDAADGDDNLCVATSTRTSVSWNGAEQVTPNTLGATQANGGTASTVTTATTLTASAYVNHIAKIVSGTASGCWGKVKSNDTSTITVYGSWLDSNYGSNCGTPDATSQFQVFNDYIYDNSYIGDYTCSGSFPNGTVVHNSYPTTAQCNPASCYIALEVADCYDGRRDLLPAESDRAVISGAATGADATSLTDTAQDLAPNTWIGQKLLITGGTGRGSYGLIESNASTIVSVASWSGASPSAGSSYKIIYIVPHSAYASGADIFGTNVDDPKGNKGPLTPTVLADWKGTRLPTSGDFFGYCGVKAGNVSGSAGDSMYYSSGASSNTALGNYGGNVGRGKNPAPYNNYINLSNTSNEWLSEQYNYNGARNAGTYACSFVGYYYVYNGYRFRAVFRP